jgi:hypothetical protein
MVAKVSCVVQHHYFPQYDDSSDKFRPKVNRQENPSDHCEYTIQHYFDACGCLLGEYHRWAVVDRYLCDDDFGEQLQDDGKLLYSAFRKLEQI